MVKPILQIGNEILTKSSARVEEKEILSREIQDLIQDLKDTCNLDPDTSAGLSAVQIGVLKRVYLVRRIDIEKEEDPPMWEAMINPEVEQVGNKHDVIWEGCLSIGTDDNRLFGPVERPSHVKVRYTNQEGEQRELEAKGFMAHIIQHEQDHLDGILFLKYIDNPQNLWKLKDLDKYIAENDHYPSIL
jgi:peptide deformylase